jgi:probable F420-dependent oxidoreductase
MKFGVMMFPTDYSIGPAELARAVEELGFESLWLPEHTHMPLEHSPWYGGPELPRHYSHSLDPFIALAAAAAATSGLRLGTGISLVAQHDPITLAKEIATLDQISGGRFLFGIGAGWNREEVANHGVDPRFRWRVLREKVLAMKAIWTQDEAEYHGRYVDFDPIWSWPKPSQEPHPPIIMGGDGPRALEGLLEYCDAWMPHPDRTGQTFAERIAGIQERAAAAGRGRIPVTAFGGDDSQEAIAGYQAAGAERFIARFVSGPADEVLPQIRQFAKIARSFG